MVAIGSYCDYTSRGTLNETHDRGWWPLTQEEKGARRQTGVGQLQGEAKVVGWRNWSVLQEGGTGQQEKRQVGSGGGEPQ